MKILFKSVIIVSLAGLVAIRETDGFSVSAGLASWRPIFHGNRSTIRSTRTTRLAAGFGTSDYLSRLSGFAETPTERFSTDSYLNNLARQYQAVSIDTLLFQEPLSSATNVDSFSTTNLASTDATATLSSFVTLADAPVVDILLPSVDTPPAGSIDAVADLFVAQVKEQAAAVAAAATESLDGSSTLMAEAFEAGISEASDSLNSLATQLSDLSYGSLVDEKASQTVAVAAQKTVSTMDVGTSNQVAEKLSTVGENLSISMNQMLSQIAKSAGDIAQRSGMVMQKAGKAFEISTADLVKNVVVTEETILSNSKATVQAAGELSITDVANGVVKGLQQLGVIAGIILNAILEALTGQTLQDVVTGAQKSATGVVNGAVESVVRTMSEIGEMSLAEVAKSFVALTVMVVKVLLKILDTVVEMISGKSATAWGLTASQTINEEATRLGTQASLFADDVTHKSFNTLIESLGIFVEKAGKGMVSTAGVAWTYLDNTSTLSNLQ